MPSGQAKVADDAAESIRSVVDRLVSAELSREISRRGREVAATLAERGAEMGERAADAWREAEPTRRETTRRIERASRDAARWTEKTWHRSLRPLVRDLWKRRAVAIGAAAAAVPVGREVVDEAAHRLKVRRREERRWGTFFLGLVLGAIAGAIVALLTAPKPGSQMRHELGARAEGMRDEITARARDAEWVPLFERDEAPAENGGGRPSGAAQEAAAEEAAAEAAPAASETAERPSPETPEPITEPVDEVEREGL